MSSVNNISTYYIVAIGYTDHTNTVQLRHVSNIYQSCHIIHVFIKHSVML